ncbi:MAG TPA: hypothetical protein VIC27_05000 [Ktedonobacterales bacterium]|jgi:hypothetical protein
MTTMVHLTVWGPQAGSALANEVGWQQQETVARECVQHALAQHTPTLRAQSICVAQDCRMRGGARCPGYVITVVVSVSYEPTAPSAVCALECQVESHVSVALLELLTPIDVEQVEVVSAASDSTISA